MIITLAITRDEGGPEYFGDYGTVHDALNGAVAALLRYPRAMIDALDDDRTILWCAWREKLSDDFVTIEGDISGKIGIGQYINPQQEGTT